MKLNRTDNLELREKILSMTVEEMNSEFQVIITDHAKLDNSEFQEAIVEEWRNGKKLIPKNGSFI